MMKAAFAFVPLTMVVGVISSCAKSGVISTDSDRTDIAVSSSSAEVESSVPVARFQGFYNEAGCEGGPDDRCEGRCNQATSPFVLYRTTSGDETTYFLKGGDRVSTSCKPQTEVAGSYVCSSREFFGGVSIGADGTCGGSLGYSLWAGLCSAPSYTLRCAPPPPPLRLRS